MRNNACLLIAMCAVLAVSTARATESAAPHHHHHHGRHVMHTAPMPTAERPVPATESRPDTSHSLFAPYAHPGEGDDDGLSRDPDECMKGCIGGNPG